jgi:signal transduction histidine kinase
MAQANDEETALHWSGPSRGALITAMYLVVGRNVDETREISRVVGGALGLGLLPAFCFWLLAGAWLSVRAQRRVEEVNLRVQRIIAGDLRERLPHRNIDEPFSRLAAIVNGMLDELETTIHALAGVGNDIAHDLRTPLTRARLTLERGRTNATTLEQLQAAADKAIAGIDQSLSIVTALLRLAEIENSRGRPHSAMSSSAKCCARSATCTSRSPKTSRSR